ncbi:hypothetical protein [Sphaerobacter sp.]|uniref:hypothetical protein n=1 Tax=Sphaerobacter sp. TaxID=2099654 RepID=UPI001D6C3F2B|nr:hypothetical protein [Sphaerobacter sp.]MBX5445349.1 hypothetical protein [Sphaerobacter sp.]
MTVAGDIAKTLHKVHEDGWLVDRLERTDVLSHSEADALALALADIAESMETVYSQLVPRLLKALKAEQRDEVLNALWDLREAFRHVDYHIHDAKLTEL